MARHQIRTVVRTSVNQVSNAASKQVYKANEDVTEKYRYVATLDSRTSALCASLDGQEFEYDKGPEPPQHFNCRSTTVAVIDWDGLRKKYPKLKFDDPAEGKRAAAGGMVPADTTYGKWLHGQRARTKSGKLSQFTPGPRQIEALGEGKAKYFNRLANKYGPDEAIKKFVRTDGTEISLAQLKKRYPKLTSIKKKVVKAVPSKTVEKVLPSMGELQGLNRSSKIKQVDIDDAFKLMTEMEGQAGINAKKLVKFSKEREVFSTWSTGRELTRYGKGKGYGYLMENPQFKKSLEKGLARKDMGFTDNVNKMLIDRGHRAMRGVIDLIEGRKNEYLGQLTPWRSLTMWREKGAAGYTFMGANHIVMRNSSKFKRITSLKDIVRSIKEGVKKAGSKQLDLSQLASERFADSPFGISRSSQSWLTTYVHEMGHQVHYAARKPMLGGGGPYTAPVVQGTYIPSGYGGSNNMEQFAETFVQYIFDPVGLKKVSPEAYAWVDDALAKTLKAK
jgi:SPP1 gp7 family putative phage head morphogenesis protein